MDPQSLTAVQGCLWVTYCMPNARLHNMAAGFNQYVQCLPTLARQVGDMGSTRAAKPTLST